MRALALFIILGMTLSGCVSGLVTPASTKGTLVDLATALPAASGFFNKTGDPCYKVAQQPCTYTPFHKLDELYSHILGYANQSRLAKVTVIGESRQHRPMYDITITNPDTPAAGKLVTLFDGGHHANEIEGIEQPLFVIDFLLENYGHNASITRWVDTMEMHFVPVLNPDGYVAGTRGNGLGVNLNRNYDVDWGDPYGASNPVMGVVSDKTGIPVQSQAIVAENCGASAFSEPETRAMRDLMANLSATGRWSFYYTHHTPTNGFIAPWAAGRAPFDIPANQSAVFEAELQWVRTHTEYKAGKAQWGNFSAGLPYSASGSSMDWAYAKHGVPAFTLEIAIYYTSVFSDDYVNRYYLQPYKGLDYWMRSALPISLQMLANAEHFRNWEAPTNEPPLPPGAPPMKPASGTPLWYPEGDEEAWRPSVPAVNDII